MTTKTRALFSSLLCSFLVCIAFVAPPVVVHAAEEIPHPFFQSDEFKRFLEEQTTGGAEIETLQREQARLIEQRQSYGVFGLDLVHVLMDSFGINQTIVLALLSILLIILYLIYLKKYNAAKWYIMFQSRKNVDLLLKSVKQYNNIVPILCFAALLYPGICYSKTTSVFEDLNFFLFGDEVHRNYVITKYPKKSNSLNYSQIKGIFVYKNFEEGTFEQHYDFLVHKHAIDIEVDSADLSKLIEQSRTLDHLTTSYVFIFSLDDALLKKVIASRFDELVKLRTSTEFKLKEAEIVLDRAKEKNKRGVVQDDVLLLLNSVIQSVPPGDVGNVLTLSALLLELEPAKSLELYTRVRYSFEEIFKSGQNTERFHKVFAALSHLHDMNKLYDLNEFRTRVERVSDRVKVLLGTFFDRLNEQLVGTIVRTIPVDKVTFSDLPEMEQLAVLIKKYRPSDAKALYVRLLTEYCKSGAVTLPYFAGVASALGYARDQVVDDVIRTDLDLYANQDERSVIVTKEFLSFLSDSQMERYLDYLKKRPQHARLILDVLINRHYALFLDYLDAIYLTAPARIADAKFANKLVRFERWTDFIASNLLESFHTLPFYYFLADREVTRPAPDARKIKELTEKRLGQLLLTVISTNKKLDDSDWVHALILYHIFRKASDPDSKAMTVSLEEIIRLQLVDKLHQRRESQNGLIQRLKVARDSLHQELRPLRAAQYKFYVAAGLGVLMAVYTLAACLYSIKYAIHAVLSYTGTRIALFVLVFAETMAKFLVPILYFTVPALIVIIAVQLYAFLRSKDGEYPNPARSLAFSRTSQEG